MRIKSLWSAPDGNHEALASARRDAIVLGTLIAAVLLLIWNGSRFFHALSFAEERFGVGVKVASTALTLNVALILFGWRRYVDLQHEAEKRAEGEARAALIATTDAMTGLLNRKGFADRGEQLARDSVGGVNQIAVMSLQIHRFKAVNDRHGYDVGDALLRLIAESLTDAAGSEVSLARLGGDEFAIVMARPSARMHEAERIGDHILRAVTRPFEIDGKVIQVGAFVGIAAMDAGDVSMSLILRRADIAMDHAKSSRTARPVWFDAGMERALIAHSELEQGVRYGLEHQQFLPYFEPQVDLRSGEIIGFEMLARWNHPLTGIIAPDVFIPIAEEIGLIGKLSEQVVRMAMQRAAHWDPKINLSINISPAQLDDPWLAQKIVRLLAETNFPAERLTVEITESSLFSDLELARNIVTSLKNQGVKIALDDFGTGFSSLSHLRSLPFDAIKIDRSFVSTMHRDRESAAIVRAVTTLASAISVPVTVEGIENAATHTAVLGFGCAHGQGWYFGKPMSADQAEQLLRARSEDQVAPQRAAN